MSAGTLQLQRSQRGLLPPDQRAHCQPHRHPQGDIHHSRLRLPVLHMGKGEPGLRRDIITKLIVLEHRAVVKASGVFENQVQVSLNSPLLGLNQALIFSGTLGGEKHNEKSKG